MTCFQSYSNWMRYHSRKDQLLLPSVLSCLEMGEVSSAIRNMATHGFPNRYRYRYRYRMGVFSSISIPIPMAISMGSSQFAPYCELLIVLLKSLDLHLKKR